MSETTGETVSDPPAMSEPLTLVRLEDLLSDRDVLLAKEQRDGEVLRSIASPDPSLVRTRLKVWALDGFPQFTELMTVSVTPPAQCSDASVRPMIDYIPFVSGATLEAHMAVLRSKLPDFRVDYEYTGPTLRILVSRG